MSSPTKKTLKVADIEPALDQRHLYAQGLAHIQKLSWQQWTDHNAHDPGITILELLCYALTELTYRASFPLEDLLAVPADNARTMADQFYTAAEILPNRPLTTLDYRKLLIDLPGVRNAWIHPEPLRYFADTIEKKLRHDDLGSKGSRPVDVRGLYLVRIEYEDDVNTEADRKQVVDAALALLHAERNLCEDFVAVEGVSTQYYNLCAEIELTPDGDPVEVSAQISFQVDQYLAPPIYNYSRAEMLDKLHKDGSPYTAQEVFAGPRLSNGFLDDAEVTRADLSTEVRLSDIIGVIMDLPGVLAVRDIVVNELQDQPDGSLKAIDPENKWRLPVPAGKQPRLAVERGRLVFYKRNLPLQPDLNKVGERLRSLQAEQRARFRDIGQEDLPIPLGHDRNTANYHSFQNHFPAVYGLSEVGVPGNPGPERLAQVLQLKGYLLLFDQVLADYFAQLSQIRSLFSRTATELKTYFSQFVELPFAGHSKKDHQRLYPNPLPTVDDLAAEPLLLAKDRRNRLLDHLLARVAEDFHHYVSIMQTAFGKGDLIATKSDFLRDYPQLGGERGLAYNYTLSDPDSLWNSLNVSGLERRLARLLGIGDFSRRNLATVSYDAYGEVEKTTDEEFRFRVKHRVSGKVLLSSSTNYVTPEAAHAEMERAITRGRSLDAYERKVDVDGRHYFNIIDTAGEIIACCIENFASAEAMEAAITELVTYLLEESYSEEGMYLIENILLRPDKADDPFLPICVDPNCSDCPDGDPYSYRVQFVLPAYAGRFQNMDFRQFVEETIRLETPAHILPKICWVDADEMAKFEQAYRDWISLRAGATSADRTEKLIALNKALFEMKNVYPKRKLHDCGGEKPPFILDRTQLGTS